MRKIHLGLIWRIVCSDIDQNLIRKNALIIPIISYVLEYQQSSNERGVIKKRNIITDFEFFLSF